MHYDKDGWLIDDRVAVSPEGNVAVVDYGHTVYVVKDEKMVGRFTDFKTALLYAKEPIMEKTLRQHIDEHPEASNAAVIIFTVEDILDMFTGEVTADGAIEVLRQLDKGIANEAIHDAIEGVIDGL